MWERWVSRRVLHRVKGTLASPMLFRRSSSPKDRFERLAEEVFPSVMGSALRLTRNSDDASDLVQEAMIRAYEAFDRFDGRNFKAWILRILTNLYINRYRQRQRETPSASLEDENVLEPMAPEGIIPDRQLLESMMDAEVEEALMKLPSDFRVAVELCDVQGLSYEEIAEATTVPIGTVRSRIARGRAMLRRELEGYATSEGYLRKGADN